MKLIDKLTKAYRNESVYIREKATTLLWINVILGIAFIVFAILRVKQASYIVAAGELVTSLLLGINIFILLKGRFKISSNASIAIFVLAAFIIFILQENSNEIDDVYVFSTYLLSVICVTPLLSYRITQMIAVIVVGVIGQIAFYFILFGLDQVLLNISEVGIAIFFVIMACGFAALVFRFQLNSFRNEKAEKENAAESFEKINKLIDSMSKSFDIGERLSEAAEMTSNESQIIGEQLKSLANLAISLEEASSNSSKAYKQIFDSEKNVKENISIQTNAISQSTSSIEEIIAQIKSMNNSASSKLEILTELNESSQLGAEKLNDSLKSIDNLSESSAQILEVISVIEGISERTNLLAMNAAIEAAHAGDSGRGFAVVAGEIRKLSEETSNNSSAIRRTIENNNNHFEESSKTTRELKTVFETITEQIKDVGNSLSELVNNLQELLVGSESITISVKNLFDTNTNVKGSLETMEGDINDGQGSIEDIEQAIIISKETINKLLKIGNSIMEESEKLQGISKENKDSVKKLNYEMSNMKNG